MKLSRSFYVDLDACAAAEALLGNVLVTRLDRKVTSGIITETEAYMGIDDRASHAFGGRRTQRNETMYATGGTAYVYLCYGIHHLFNVVVGPEDVPHAVLIRAIVPLDGISTMVVRRPKARSSTNGPGTLSQALGISTALNGNDLTGDRIWIDDRRPAWRHGPVQRGPRIGVEYAGDDALLPYRYRIAPSQLEFR